MSDPTFNPETGIIEINKRLDAHEDNDNKRFNNEDAKLDKIIRGIYGDEDNEQEGIIKKVNRHERMYNLFRLVIENPKISLIGGGLLIYSLTYLTHIGIDKILVMIFK